MEALSRKTVKFFLGDGDDVVTIHSGSIVESRGGVFLEDGEDIVQHEGILAGELSLGKRADLVSLNSGSVVESTGRIFLGNGDDVVRHEGTLSGYIFLDGGEDLVTLNNGSVVGSSGVILFGTGDDTLVMEDGAVFEGRAHGGSLFGTPIGAPPIGGNDTLTIRNDGVALAQFSGFELIEIETAGEVLDTINELIADQGGAHIDIRSGTLRINNFLRADTLFLSEGAKLAGNGTLRLLSNDPLHLDGIIVPSASLRFPAFSPSAGPMVDGTLDIDAPLTSS